MVSRRVPATESRPDKSKRGLYQITDAFPRFWFRFVHPMGFLPERVGSWWDRAAEVDVVAVSDGDGALLLGECKWSVNPVGIDMLDDLQQKRLLVDPPGHRPNVSYALFAKAGFTPALLDRAAAEGVRLVGPEALVEGEGNSGSPR